MYKETLKVAVDEKLPTKPEVSKGDDKCKVNRICDAVLEVLRSRGSTYIQNVITAHVCKVPPDLDAGLTEIAKLRSTF